MAAFDTQARIEEVLFAAREELEAQLDAVRGQLARLGAEERQLTQTLARLPGGGGSSSARAATPSERGRARAPKPAAARRAPRKAGAKRGRVAKPTVERVAELRAVLAAGPKSQRELAAALELSVVRVHQLLGQLGDAVSSQPNPAKPGKLWSIARPEGNGASAATASTSQRQAQTKRGPAAKPRARTRAATK